MEHIRVSDSDVLTAILTSDYFKESLSQRNIEDERAFYGYQRRLMDFQVETLESFFEQDLKDILENTEI
jgi:hypothetical protein